MDKTIKDFTVEDWVSGVKTNTLLRVEIIPEAPSPKEQKSLPEAIIQLKKLEYQYFELLEQNKSLEEQLYNAQCQIRALQASSIITTQEDPKEASLGTHFKDYRKTILKKTSEDLETQSLSSQIYFQNLIIEDLMCKLQNMHQKVEYYKEDVSELKVQYEREKSFVEEEKRNKYEVDGKHHQAQTTIKRLEAEIQRVRTELKEAIERKEVQVKVIEVKSDYQIDAENMMLQNKMDNQVSSLRTKYYNDLLDIQKKNQTAVENLGLCMKKRIDDLKNFYEYRISSMINEFAFEEAKFYSKIQALKQEITDHFEKSHEFDVNLSIRDKTISMKSKNISKAENTIKNLKKLLERMSFGYIEQKSKSQSMIEGLIKHSQEVENDLKRDFEHQMKIAEKNHEEAMKGLKNHYQMKIDKINQEFQISEKKIMERDKKQYNVLLDEIAKIEKDKTEIEMETESRVQDVLREAKAKYLEYEKILDFSKKKILDEWNNDRKHMTLEHEHKMKEAIKSLKEIHEKKIIDIRKEHESIIEHLENKHNETITELNKKYSDQVFNIEEKHLIDVARYNNEIEKHKNDIKNLVESLNLANQETEAVRNQLSEEIRVEQDKYMDLQHVFNDLRAIKIKMQAEYEEKLNSVNNTLVEKENVLKYKYETEKNVAISHLMQEKNEKELIMQRKISEISKKYEDMVTKYNSLKQKKPPKITEINSQKLTRELLEKDKLIDQLRKEKNDLKISLEYMNSTVRIFSSQEQIFHTKNASQDSKISKKIVKRSKLSNTIRF